MTSAPDHLEEKVLQLADRYQPLAVELLREAVRLPADYVDRPPAEGGDPDCGLSNHEGPRLEYLRQKIVEVGAVADPADVGFDSFGNLRWTVSNPNDGVPGEEKTVIYLDGHTDTVKALRRRWHEAIGGGIDPHLGLTDPEKIDRGFLRRELGYLPPDDDWEHLVWGRGSADQLGGVVCQIVATKILCQLVADGALDGIVVVSYATVAEENNDGGGPMFFMRQSLAGADASRVPDLVIFTEGTGCAEQGALGIYRGQRGRMQIEVEVTGKAVTARCLGRAAIHSSTVPPSSLRRPSATPPAAALAATPFWGPAAARRALPCWTHRAIVLSPSASPSGSIAVSPPVRIRRPPSRTSSHSRRWRELARPVSRSRFGCRSTTDRHGRATGRTTPRSIRGG